MHTRSGVSKRPPPCLFPRRPFGRHVTQAVHLVLHDLSQRREPAVWRRVQVQIQICHVFKNFVCLSKVSLRRHDPFYPHVLEYVADGPERFRRHCMFGERRRRLQQNNI